MAARRIPYRRANRINASRAFGVAFRGTLGVVVAALAVMGGVAVLGVLAVIVLSRAAQGS